jgi:hypothetical protein
MTEHAFSFFDEVRVEPCRGSDPELEAVRGRLGVIDGLSIPDGEDPLDYGVYLDPTDAEEGEGWEIDEDDLVATGKRRSNPTPAHRAPLQTEGKGEQAE